MIIYIINDLCFFMTDRWASGKAIAENNYHSMYDKYINSIE
jgi:hypothetical protein